MSPFRLRAEHSDDPRTGGKGRGLALLLACGARVPETLVIAPQVEDLSGALELLCAPFAVRSSGHSEDGRDRSFAGQLDSYLRVEAAELAGAVARCRASGSAQRALQYAGQAQAVSVLLQPMLSPQRSGVLFTCDPVSGSRNHILVESVAGTAEQLLAGTLSGSRQIFDRSGQRLAGACDFEGEQLVLQALQLEQQLAALGLPGPLDFEWAVCDGQVVWLQVRPVTAWGARTQSLSLGPGEQPRVAPDEVHWTSANAREALPGVAPALIEDVLAAVIQDGFGASFAGLGLKLPEAPLAAVFEGRAFLNVTALRELVGQLPLLNPEAQVEKLLGVPSNPPIRVRPSPALLARVPMLLWSVLTLSRDYRRFLAQEMERFPRLDPSQLASPQLLDQVRSLLDLRGLFRLHALGTGLYTALYAALEKLAPAPGAFLQGLGQLRFGSAAAALRELARRQFLDPHIDHMAGFLEEYGHLGSGTIDLAAPPWSERPEQVQSLVDSLLERGEVGGRAAYLAQLRERRQAAQAELAARLPLLERLRFHLLVRALQWAAPYRENLKFYAHRRLMLMRRYLLELGRRHLSRPQDVFYLHRQELEGLLEGHPPGDLEERQRLERRRQRLGYPLHRVEGPGGPRLYFSTWMEGQTRLQGTPGSPGIFRGSARVLLSLEEAARVKLGDVLVTHSTDPSWTGLFSLVGAVVVEVGSALSHGAVVAREVGVPAVLGLPGIVSAVRDGQQIEVDGSLGLVRLGGESGAG